MKEWKKYRIILGQTRANRTVTHEEKRRGSYVMYVMESAGGFRGKIDAWAWCELTHYAPAQGRPTCLDSLCVSAFLIKGHNRSSWQTGRQPEKPAFTFLLHSWFALPSLRSCLLSFFTFLDVFFLYSIPSLFITTSFASKNTVYLSSLWFLRCPG